MGEKEPNSYEVQGKILKCLVCGHEAFWRREAQLNTTGLSFLNLDWLNRSANCLVCDRCGYIHWFLPK